MNRIKSKIVYSDYDEQNGISVVTISTDLGKFTGKSFLNFSQDAEYESTMQGCYYAELRALRQYTIAKLAQLRAIYKYINNIENQLRKNQKAIFAEMIGKQKLLEQIKYYSYVRDNTEKVISAADKDWCKSKDKFKGKSE
jgi:hypothetical protein